MEQHVLQQDPVYRELMGLHACEWRVESGSLPGCSVGDVVEIDVGEEDEYTFWRPDGVRVASVPIASTESERNNVSNWVELRNRAAGISVWLSPSDRFITEWLKSHEGRGHRGGSSTTEPDRGSVTTG